MLFTVLGSSLLQRPRVVGRWLRLALIGALALGAVLPASSALAQNADDAGWFDPPPAAEPAPAPYYDEPVVGDAAPPAPTSDIPDTDPSALTTFRPALDPYGAWVSDSQYGTVWVPNRDVVGPDFAPYVSRGHWALTADDDWIWASDYPFGWAVFHYGRWVWIPANGWAWVPGRTYANAWVVWRVPTAGYAYVGWAPMPPTWGWRNGYAFGLWYSPPLPYVFCPSAYVFHHHVHHHIVRDRHVVNDIARHSHVYPTPYRAPAQPSRHTAATPSPRARPAPPPVGPSRAPRGPAISAARVPAQAVPAVRTAPPPNTRLVSSRVAATDTLRQRVPASSDARVRSSSSPRIPAGSRDTLRDAPRRSAPTAAPAWPAARPAAPRSSAPRTTVPDRVRVEPRHVAPRTVAPRTVAPSRIRVAPPSSRSLSPAPTRSTAPALPHVRSSGSIRRR